MIRKLVIVAVVTLLTAAALGTGITSASAADPLGLAPVTPGAVGFNRYELSGIYGHSFTAQLQATGGVAPYTFEPGAEWGWYGLTVTPSGFVSGTIGGAYPGGVIGGLRLWVHDAEGTVAATPLQIRIEPDFRITTASLPNGTAKSGYWAQVTATDGTAPFQFAKGSALPSGMKLSKTGVLSGTPKWGGVYTVAINAKDSATVRKHFATRTYTLTIAGAPKPSGGGTGGGGNVPAFAATGDVSCGGGVTLKAKGQGGPSPYVIAQMKAKITCNGGTGNSKVSIKNGTVNSTYALGQVCSVLGDKKTGSNATFLPFAIDWKTTGGSIFSTQAAFDGHRASTDGFRLPVPDGTGASQVTGSYAGIGTASVAIAVSPSQLQTVCSGFPAKAIVTGVFLMTL
jgi:hypothetical protein